LFGASKRTASDRFLGDNIKPDPQYVSKTVKTPGVGGVFYTEQALCLKLNPVRQTTSLSHGAHIGE
jgi:hypothetical protein